MSIDQVPSVIFLRPSGSHISRSLLAGTPFGYCRGQLEYPETETYMKDVTETCVDNVFVERLWRSMKHEDVS